MAIVRGKAERFEDKRARRERLTAPPAGWPGWRGTGFAAPLDPVDAIALLVRIGAAVIGTELELPLRRP
jgi:hypothetical protein